MSAKSTEKLASAIAGVKTSSQLLYDLGGGLTAATALYGGLRALSETLDTRKNPNRYFYTPGITSHVLSNALRGGLAGLSASSIAGLTYSLATQNKGLKAIGALSAALPAALYLLKKKSPGYSPPSMEGFKADPVDLNTLRDYLKKEKDQSFEVSPEEYLSYEEKLAPGQYVSNGE
jgi:hypothetical protein